MVCAESRGAQKKTMKVIKIQMQFLPRLVLLNIKSFFHEIFRVGRAYPNANPNNVKIWLKMFGLGKDRSYNRLVLEVFFNIAVTDEQNRFPKTPRIYLCVSWREVGIP